MDPSTAAIPGQYLLDELGRLRATLEDLNEEIESERQKWATAETKHKELLKAHADLSIRKRAFEDAVHLLSEEQ